MKKLTTLLAGGLLATASFATFAAEPIDHSRAQSMQSIGNVSVSGVRGSLDDADRQLSQKAKEMGASHYRIIGVDNPGDSSLWTGTAEIYR